MSDLPPVLTLKEVLPYVRRSRQQCWELLRTGKFPIRTIDTRPYLFARADVMAYAERGEKTNPLLADRPSQPRAFFGRRRSA